MMALSMYYSARRPTPLSAEEQAEIQKVLARYCVDSRVKRFAETGEGLNWQPFGVSAPSDNSAADVVFEGSTPLPDNTEDAFAAGVLHWCNALSALRQIIQKALWSVRVEDQEIAWDYQNDRYDPAK
jgi:hypothetical protein